MGVEETIEEPGSALRALHAVCEASPAIMGIVELYEGGGILHLYGNSACAGFFGRTQQELRGRSLRELGFDEGSAASWLACCEEAMLTSRSAAFEGIRITDATGSERVLAGAVISPADHGASNGGPLCYVAQEVARSPREPRFRDTFESAAVGIAHVALDGSWLRVNARACEITGYTRAALLQTTFMQITHPQDVQADWAQSRLLIEGRLGFYTMEKRYVRPDGSVVPVELTVSLARAEDGKPDYFISIIQDVTERQRIADELAASEARLRLALEAANTGLWTWDPISDAVTWSIETYGIHGLATGEFAGTGVAFFRLVHPHDRARVEAAVRSAIAERRRYECEFRIVRPDGSIVWVANRGRASYRADGQPSEIVGTITDITARKDAEAITRRSEQRLRFALAASRAGVWEWDIARGQMQWSAESYSLFGVPPALEPRSHADWQRNVAPADLPRVKQAIADVAEGRRAEFREEFRVAHPDLGARWLLAVGQLQETEDGQPLCVSGLNIDISEHKRLETALRDADAQKDRFIAVLSHELRNPLAPIRSASSLLAREDATPKQVAAARQIIQRQVKHITLLLDDLLDVARITQGKLALQRRRVGIASVFDAAVESSRPLIDSKHHRLAIDLPATDPVIDADPLRIAQVLSNLLHNAAKYTDPGGQIELAAQVDGTWVRIEVRDNGIGLSDAALGRIFAMFSQDQAAIGRSEGGLGIGLALVKGMVELHGGTVEAFSAGPGRGSRFVVRLPVADGSASAPTARDASTGAAMRGYRILVADDNQDNADSLALLLGCAGHEVRVAYGGHAALSLAQPFRPEVALVDLEMPVLDGYAVARALRREGWATGIRLIALSGRGQEEDKRRALEAGFDQHFTKPIDPEALVRVLAPQEQSRG